MHKISTNLWFDDQAEEAARFYTSVFPDSRLGRIARYGEAGHDVHGREAGTVMTVEFELEGQPFVALNGGPHFQFNEAISLIVHCDSQEEVDYYWAQLGEGGDPAAQQCGWLKDKYGLSWQVVPTAAVEMMNDPDYEKSQRVMQAVLAMKKIDIAALEKVYNQSD